MHAAELCVSEWFRVMVSRLPGVGAAYVRDVLRNVLWRYPPGIVIRAEDRIDCRVETLLQSGNPETQLRLVKKLHGALKAELVLSFTRRRKSGQCTHSQTSSRGSNEHRRRLSCLDCGALLESVRLK